jgi:hypothetical protein
MAQDTIVTREAKQISAWVFEVNGAEVRYKNFDNVEGPTYTLLKSKLVSIKYQTGKLETFEEVIVTRDAEEIKAFVLDTVGVDVKYKKFTNPGGPTYRLAKSKIVSIKYQDGTIKTFEEETLIQDEETPDKTPVDTVTQVTPDVVQSDDITKKNGEITKKRDEKKKKSDEKTKVVDKTHADATVDKGGIFLMPGASVGSALSWSLMAGYMGDWGGYVKAKSNFAPNTKNTADESGVFFKSNYTKIGRTTFSAGVIKRITPTVHLYGGVGYGTKSLLWQDISSTIYKVEDHSYSGIEPEIGVIFQIQRFVISGGASALIGDKTNIEASIGIGYKF